MKEQEFLSIALLAICVLFSGCGLLVTEEQVLEGVKEQGYQEPLVTKRHIVGIEKAGCHADDDVCFSVLTTCLDGERKVIPVGANYPFNGVTIRLK